MGFVLVALVAPLAQVLLVDRSVWGGPDLVALAVLWPALARGPVWGCVAGLVAGLAADVTPPADGTVGRTALALSLTGLLAGWLGRPSRATRRPLVAGVLGAGLGTVLPCVAAAGLGDEVWASATAGLPLTLAWTVPLGAVLGALHARRRPAAGVVPRRV
ncbi:hypothetical protein HCN51_38685 [Nonomuraea sp. FMUSA5-5]|uniref:Rod shape-determining protein MreD n=1 Tax=Nonomuraea composti TaxID=2720023 RepID=A0ABX1BHS5_9ACTN|nr:hypothetical protein [Nonomuraea sp. FMUSA5-5]NJP95299.1 hypothetical protein [Nonomuraea sp. FMUSA5-5]